MGKSTKNAGKVSKGASATPVTVPAGLINKLATVIAKDGANFVRFGKLLVTEGARFKDKDIAGALAARNSAYAMSAGAVSQRRKVYETCVGEWNWGESDLALVCSANAYNLYLVTVRFRQGKLVETPAEVLELGKAGKLVDIVNAGSGESGSSGEGEGQSAGDDGAAGVNPWEVIIAEKDAEIARLTAELAEARAEIERLTAPAGKPRARRPRKATATATA